MDNFESGGSTSVKLARLASRIKKMKERRTNENEDTFDAMFSNS